ncbi:MAG: hypothetical protein LBS86_00850 [Treponema sp.]|jgi:hypothetical protein|nr:hypothetical protein [Treponema sp.]
MIDAALTDEEVEALSFSLMVDLTTLFKSLRADVIDAIRSDDPLAALDAVFDVIPLDADDEADADDQEAAAVYVDDVLTVLKGIERELRPMVAKAREGDRKEGIGGTLILHGGHWQLEGERDRRPDIHVKADIALDEGFTLKKGATLTAVKVMAAGSKIHDVNYLVQQNPLPNGKLTSPQDWEKVRGTAIVSDGKSTKTVDIHWYQCKNIGKIGFKIKEKDDNE